MASDFLIKSVEDFTNYAKNNKNTTFIEIHKKHGVTNDHYGLSIATLSKLGKTCKKNTHLLKELWESQIWDAQVLVCYTLDAKELTIETIKKWALDINDYAMAGIFASFLFTDEEKARQFIDEFYQNPQKWHRTIAYNTLARLAIKGKKTPDSYFEKYKDHVVPILQKEENRVKEAMYSFLAALAYRESYYENILNIVDRLGIVEIDHGNTNCTTHDHRIWLRKDSFLKRVHPHRLIQKN